MHGFRDNEVSLQAGYDVIVSSPLGGASANFHDAFWKSDHDFLIAFHTNILSRIHGIRDNEVSLQAGNDFIVISSLLGVSHRFCWRNLKERARFHSHGSLTYFAYLLPFRSYSKFYFWLGEGLKFYVSALLRRTRLIRLSPGGLPVITPHVTRLPWLRFYWSPT